MQMQNLVAQHDEFSNEENRSLLKYDEEDTLATVEGSSESDESSYCSLTHCPSSLNSLNDIESGEHNQEEGTEKTLDTEAHHHCEELPDAIKLLIGVGGVYATLLYYGTLQEDVFRFRSSADNSAFTETWFLGLVESFLHLIVGYIGMVLSGPTPRMPLKLFAVSGASQVTSKALTNLALTHGLSYPVATLAKCSKMAPIMAGSLVLDGTRFSIREYLQVLAVVTGSFIVSLGTKKSNSSGSSLTGALFIVLSLVMSGTTGGVQKRIQTLTAQGPGGQQVKQYDFMFWTSLFMCLTSGLIAFVSGELTSGLAFCLENTEIRSKIIQFAICSAIGQSFLFYTLAHFDPLVVSTVTTSRKIFSVLISIVFKGNSLSTFGWLGVGVACTGILSEFFAIISKGPKSKSKTKPSKAPHLRKIPTSYAKFAPVLFIPMAPSLLRNIFNSSLLPSSLAKRN